TALNTICLPSGERTTEVRLGRRGERARSSGFVPNNSAAGATPTSTRATGDTSDDTGFSIHAATPATVAVATHAAIHARRSRDGATRMTSGAGAAPDADDDRPSSANARSS